MIETDVICTCGHTLEEHGGDPKYPRASACRIEDCDCISFEEDYQ
jgi:hypothetical protein